MYIFAHVYAQLCAHLSLSECAQVQKTCCIRAYTPLNLLVSKETYCTVKKRPTVVSKDLLNSRIYATELTTYVLHRSQDAGKFRKYDTVLRHVKRSTPPDTRISLLYFTLLTFYYLLTLQDARKYGTVICHVKRSTGRQDTRNSANCGQKVSQNRLKLQLLIWGLEL